MVIYAIFMCLIQPRPGIGNNCILISDHPVRGPLGVAYEDSRITSLPACKRDILVYGHPQNGYRYVCMKESVPAWSPAQ